MSSSKRVGRHLYKRTNCPKRAKTALAQIGACCSGNPDTGEFESELSRGQAFSTNSCFIDLRSIVLCNEEYWSDQHSPAADESSAGDILGESGNDLASGTHLCSRQLAQALTFAAENPLPALSTK